MFIYGSGDLSLKSHITFPLLLYERSKLWGHFFFKPPLFSIVTSRFTRYSQKDERGKSENLVMLCLCQADCVLSLLLYQPPSPTLRRFCNNSKCILYLPTTTTTATTLPPVCCSISETKADPVVHFK